MSPVATPRFQILAGPLALLMVTLIAISPETASSQTIPSRPPGITPETEEAIRKGLEFLSKNQAKDGGWRNQGGYGSYPTAMTSLAGLALAGSGSTPTRGKHAPQIRRAVDFILGSAGRDGVISDREEGRSMYGHGFSMLFLAQVLGMDEDANRMADVQKVLSKAVQLTARAQSGDGGWNYTPDMGSDEGSVTITQVQALRACRNIGVTVPKKVIDRAIQYIENSANEDGGIAYRVGQGGGSRPPITAAAVACLYNAGQYDSPVAEKALLFCERNISVSGQGAYGHYYYTHLYLAQAYYQAGGKRWEKYFPEIREWLIRNQQPDGSWQGDGVGTTYGTAIALIILQLPYKRLPICQR